MKILILGINGFIGNSLAEHILEKTDWEIFGLDMHSDKITKYLEHPRLHFKKGDMLKEQSWIEQHIQLSDAVLPLVAIATPATYVQNPLKIFELDFEANLAIVRLCVKHKKRVIFPSTSEVYGMCPDEEFNEETSSLVTGPIAKERWIYSCSKQMMDRIIYAYGARGELDYTLFRPFNWLGPKLDNILNPNPGSSRVVTQFIGNILRGENIAIVDGGKQERTFMYIDDGIDALVKIIANKDGQATKRIFNIGNPTEGISIRGLAELLLTLIKQYPKYAALAEKVKLVDTSSKDYYGAGYQDVLRRVPSIKNAKQYLGWEPKIDLTTGLKKTLDFHLL